jgi:V/A-type H+-transporting ATPase subunit I
LTLCYLGMVGAPFDLRLLWLVPLGLAWSWVGSALLAGQQWSSQLAHAMGESIETLLQLAVNTVSFVRVGAFALAHAGLSTVIGELAADIDTPALAWLVLIVGNALIVVIEGLVVGIQTTRLVLFEFFIRFLQGSGRPFLPLPAPLPPIAHVPRKSS